MRIAVPAVKPGRGPAHAQIEGWLADAVAAGKLAPGDRLPPERDLAARLRVSRMTLRHALASLEQRGLVVRHVGRDAAALGIGAREPLLLVERTASGASGRPLEHSRDLFRGDRTRVVWKAEIRLPAS